MGGKIHPIHISGGYTGRAQGGGRCGSRAILELCLLNNISMLKVKKVRPGRLSKLPEVTQHSVEKAEIQMQNPLCFTVSRCCQDLSLESLEALEKTPVSDHEEIISTGSSK